MPDVRPLRWLVALVTALAAQPAAAGEDRLSPDQTIPPAQLEVYVDGVVAQAMRRDHIAGVTVAIVQGDRTALLKGYGHASFSPRRSVDPSRTLFRIASLSKTFTWTLLMREVETGRLRLSDPVNRHLPPALRIPDEGFSEPIRLVHLMAHTAGFEEREFGASRVTDPAAFRPLPDYLRTARPHRVRAPGRSPAYSNYGVALIGPVLTGGNGDFEGLAERELLHPLGMTSTTFRQPHTVRPGLPLPMPRKLHAQVSDGFSWSGGGFRREKFELLQTVPAGSVSTTAADMARYMRFHLRGGALDGRRLYGAPTAAAFRTPLLRGPADVNGWAHGFAVSPLPGGFTGYGHGGTSLIFYTNMVLVPELDLGVFVSANTNTARALRDDLAAHIVERFYAAPIEPPPPSPELVAARARYEGRFASTRRAYHGLQKALGLRQVVELSVSGDGHLVLRGSEAQRFAPVPGRLGTFAALDGTQRLHLEYGADGRVDGWTHPNGTGRFERIGPLEDPDLLASTAWLAAAAALVSIVFLAACPPLAPAERRLGLATAAAGVAWCAAAWAYRHANAAAGDAVAFFYAWPSPAVLAASGLAMAAGGLTLGALLLVPRAFGASSAGARRLRPAVFAAALATDLALLAQVAARDGLLPWRY